jgi:hypothetical protein
MRSSTLLVSLVCLLAPAVARADDAPLAGWIGATATATSRLDASHDVGDTLGGDGDGWCAKKGDGVGEALTLAFAQPVAIKQITIYAGIIESGKPSKKWNQPTELTVTLDGAAGQAAPVDAKGKAVVAIAKPVGKIQIAFAKVTKGKKNASCIGRLVFGNDKVVAVSDAKATATLAGDGAAIAAAISSCDPAKLGAALAFPFRNGTQTIGTDDAQPENGKTFATAAALVKAKCDLPAFSLDEMSCHRAGIDALECTGYVGPTETHWSLRWKAGAWKATSATRIENGGE